MEPNFEAGKKLLELIDEEFNPLSFLWIYFRDVSNWKLIITSKKFDNKPIAESYKSLIDKFGNTQEFKNIGISNISIVATDNPLIKLLRTAIGTDMSISGIRFTSNTINGVFIDDAYIYRNAAPI